MSEINQNEVAVVEEKQRAVSSVVKATGDFISEFRECFKVAQILCKADIIPDSYRGKVEDTAIAIDMANRMNVNPMMVMQNLYVVKGKPSWSGQACKAFLKNRFDNVKTIFVGEKGTDERGCYIKATDADGDTLEGTTVTIKMAKNEGWYNKTGSKWQTMPEQMLAYRAAAFFARVHCPEILMGCQVEGESEDITDSVRIVPDVL